ncbi:MAG: adenosylcobinamide-GDP ribazoletransferase, partial [Pseudomonadota bacterium]
MSDSDTGLIELADIPRAIGFLTRLPLRVDGDAAVARGAGCVWAYPIAGLVVGTVVAAILWALMAVGVPAALTAGGAVAAGLFVTGALHEDGMADTVDGLWGGWTRERRLEIMKDSRIGAYGVLALVVTVGLRWQ